MPVAALQPTSPLRPFNAAKTKEYQTTLSPRQDFSSMKRKNKNHFPTRSMAGSLWMTVREEETVSELLFIEYANGLWT